MTMRAMIVDDEPLAVDLLARLCAQLGVKVVATAGDGEVARTALPRVRPDVLLLDIAMPELDGMTLARSLEAVRPRPAIIFCTAFEHFAVEAFDVAATGYLLKPVSVAALARAFDRVRERGRSGLSPAADAFWVPHGGELLRVAIENIDWITADGDYARLHVGPRSFLLNATLTGLEHRLGRRFVRVRHSAIVRSDFVAGLSHQGDGVWTVTLKNGESVRVGRRYRQALQTLRAA